MEQIDVIIPVYNRGAYIERAIYSVLNQTWNHVSVIVVDDCSTDSSSEVVKRITQHDSRVKLIMSPVHRGANCTRNEGLKYATSSYIAFQDSDDYWYPDKLQKQMDHLRTHNYDMVYCRVLRKHINSGRKYIFPKDTLNPEGDLLKQFLHSCMAMTPSLLMRKECFDQIKLDESMLRFQEWSFIISFVQIFRIGFVDEVLMEANMLSDSVSSNVEMGYIYITKFIDKHLDLIRQYPDIYEEFLLRKARYMTLLNMNAIEEYRLAFELSNDMAVYRKYLLCKKGEFEELKSELMPILLN